MIYHEKRPILYVDDTVEQRYAMRRILETEGFSVFEAGSGKEALTYLGSHLALAVVDVRLPDISGYELSRKLKQAEPNLPILQVSASFSDPSLRVEGFSGGADAYIAQPVHPAEMVGLIRRMLRTSEAEETLRFLASIGPGITASLSTEETADNFSRVVVPGFADRCYIHLREAGNTPAWIWPRSETLSEALQRQLERVAKQATVEQSNSDQLFAPLTINGEGLGAIMFELDRGRAYTSTDTILASDLSNRLALALQNCQLFAAEQSIRSALVQSEKLATAGRMAASIAHEINNPLEALTNLLFIIEQSPDVPPFARETATAALGEVTRLAHITRQSLGFYRELRAPAELDLSESVSETVELYRRRLIQNQIEVRLDLTPGVLIQGIKGEIRQVISNLLVNAMEVLSPGGTIWVKTFPRGETAVLEISDDGPGIPAELQEKVFEPFFTTKQATGTGLGLWITQSIIEKHGGSIRLSPKNGLGTKFEIEFPSRR
ncbi:ATP-binding protein [Terriglobus roseus]|uniref:histidine kinase n=1 Tax=Terriglobus roseus TaxID=392734 RepID=A0A1G7HEC8_9BACT|nr:ATP-binding protein [Terriglobus roseus]SDE98738.1 Response regulator receiver domain-containing protein [Terriglobus roseus]